MNEIMQLAKSGPCVQIHHESLSPAVLRQQPFYLGIFTHFHVSHGLSCGTFLQEGLQKHEASQILTDSVFVALRW